MTTVHPLILLCGFSGSGKTTAAKALEETLEHCVAIHSEDIRTELGVKQYSRADTPRVLTTQMQKLKKLWMQGKTGIVDNNLLSPILRQMFYDFARDEGRPTLTICVTAPVTTLRERIRERPYISGGSPNNSDVLQCQYLFWDEPLNCDVLINSPDLVTIVKFDTVDQTITCIRGSVIPYYSYLQPLLTIKEKLDAHGI